MSAAPKRRRCVGCHEAAASIRVPELGHVCASCNEVLDIVIDTEIERVREACATVGAVLARFDAMESLA
jgi:hypothetical protein